MKDIRIDEPGAGEWIMERVNGVFTPSHDHSIASYTDERIRGGFAFCHYLGASITMHMAGVDEKWCSRDMLWMAFDYAFNQLGVRKILGPVRSTDHPTIAIDMRAGFQLEATIRDAYPDADLMILTMTKDMCPWLRLKPREWRAGHGR